MKTIEGIVKRGWINHRNLMESSQVKDYMIQDSIPILWFGDMEAYCHSKRKIVTVGLNPSLKEFPKDKDRFPKASGLRGKKTLGEKDVEIYVAAMNAYFETEPYSKWFNHFEKALKPLDASYYAATKMPNRAIHIDIYTPSATDPTWSKLSPLQKKYIDEQSNGLYENLMDLLKPDTVLVSANSAVVKEQFPIAFKAYLGDADKGSHYLRVGKTKSGCVVIWGFNNISGPFSIKEETLKEKLMQIKKDYTI